jgi:hypothetical protein
MNFHLDAPASLRASPVLLGAALVITLACALALGSAAGVIPNLAPHRPMPYEPVTLPAPAGGDAALQCPTCGTVLMIRTYEVRGEPFDTGGATAPGTVAPGTAKATGSAVSAARPADTAMPAQDPLKKRSVFRVTLRMEDGSVRTVSQGAEPEFRPGDKVRLLPGSVVTGNRPPA